LWVSLCCQVEVSATSWSLVQRSPTDCGASLCDLETSRIGAPYIYIYIYIYIYDISSLRVNAFFWDPLMCTLTVVVVDRSLVHSNKCITKRTIQTVNTDGNLTVIILR
jgi:hypothetical protein